MAFFANSCDSFANKLFSSLPDKDIQFSSNEWFISVHLHFGIPVPLLKPFIGEKIKNNSRCPTLTVDPFAFNLTTVTGILGGGTQRNHNTIAGMVSRDLTKVGVQHIGGATDKSCKSIFRAAIPHGITNELDHENKINSIVADMAILIKQNDGPLGRADHLVDFKTLAGGLCYQQNISEFHFAVNKRQNDVNIKYHRTARELDTRLHATVPDQHGPFTKILLEHGHEGRVLAPVVGIFGEASSHLGEIRDLIAFEKAKKHCDLSRCTISEASGMYKNSLNRKWGHAIARGWSRLIIDRLRDYVTSQIQHTVITNSEASWTGVHEVHEEFQYFNLSTPP